MSFIIQSLAQSQLLEREMSLQNLFVLPRPLFHLSTPEPFKLSPQQSLIGLLRPRTGVASVPGYFRFDKLRLVFSFVTGTSHERSSLVCLDTTSIARTIYCVKIIKNRSHLQTGLLTQEGWWPLARATGEHRCLTKCLPTLLVISKAHSKFFFVSERSQHRQHVDGQLSSMRQRMIRIIGLQVPGYSRVCNWNWLMWESCRQSNSFELSR